MTSSISCTTAWMAVVAAIDATRSATPIRAPAFFVPKSAMMPVRRIR